MASDDEEEVNINLGDNLDEEMASTAQVIKDSSEKIQEMLQRSHVDDTGVKLEVNGKLLGSCADLMEAVKDLMAHCKDLLVGIVQEEMVSERRAEL